jgi:type I restriction enzyme S subunit
MSLDLSDLRFSRMSEEQLKEKDALLVEGDLLFTRYNGNPDLVGSCALVPFSGPLTYPDKLIRVRVNKKLAAPAYVALAFSSSCVRREVKLSLRSTAGQVGISGSDLKNISFPLPPLVEQRRIVSALEAGVSRLDAADASLSAVPVRSSMVLSSALFQIRSRAVSGGVERAAIGDVSETALGKMLNSRDDFGVPAPYLGNVNVRWGDFSLDSVKSVPLTDEERVRFSLKKGDLLVCEGGEPGRCAIWQGGDDVFAYQKALHRVRVGDRVRVEWMALMIEEAVRGGRISHLLTGTTIKHLSQEKLRRIKIPLPDLEVQDSLIKEYGRLRDSVKHFINSVYKAQRRSICLRQSLLNAAFAGELVPQDPSDESAAVLLERIRSERTAAPKPKRARRSPTKTSTRLASATDVRTPDDPQPVHAGEQTALEF